MTRPEKIRLGDLLVRERLITQDQLEFALNQQKSNGRRLGRILVENGFTSEEHISESLAIQLNIPYVNLTSCTLNPERIRLLPESQARRFRALVLEESNGRLLVGMCDPTDVPAMEEITRLLKRNFDLAVVTESQLLQGIDHGYLRTGEIAGMTPGASQKSGNDAHVDFGTLIDSTGTGDPSVTALLNDMFGDAMRSGASDIHIEPQDRSLKIRFRADGVLRLHTETDNRFAPALLSRIKRMARLDTSEKRLPQTGRFQVHARGQTVDVRVSTMPAQDGESAAVHFSRREGARQRLDEFGMPSPMLERLREIIRGGNGLVLVTDPDGSAATSMLYAALEEANAAEQKIITVEDPIECLLPGIVQVQVDEKIGLTFNQALRAALLQDPDVLMVGELCDEKTAQTALRAAMSGYLVFLRMHATDAASSLMSLRDMGLPRSMVHSSVQAIFAQRLLRRVCESCSEPYVPAQKEGKWLKAKGVAQEQWEGLRQGRGCPHCSGSGYRGRLGVYEMLDMGREMTEAAPDDAAHFMQAARRHMTDKTLLEHALEHIRQGHTTVAEAMRISIPADE